MIAKIITPIKPLMVFKIISFISSAPVAKIYCKISITIGIKTTKEIFLYLLLPFVNRHMKNPIGINAVRFSNKTAFPSFNIADTEGIKLVV